MVSILSVSILSVSHRRHSPMTGCLAVAPRCNSATCSCTLDSHPPREETLMKTVFNSLPLATSRLHKCVFSLACHGRNIANEPTSAIEQLGQVVYSRCMSLAADGDCCTGPLRDLPRLRAATACMNAKSVRAAPQASSTARRWWRAAPRPPC